MGSIFIEVLNAQPTYIMGGEEREKIKIAQGWAGILGVLYHNLPKIIRKDFPLLHIVSDSDFYFDEQLILHPDEVMQLQKEFHVILDACEYKQFLPEFQPEKFLEYLRADAFIPPSYAEFKAEFEESTKFTKNLLEIAVNNNAFIFICR